MNTLEFLAHLRDLGVQLTDDNGKLKVKAPKDNLTPALRAELTGRKAEIIAFLRQSSQVVHVGSSPPAITATARQEEIPLSFAQQRLWFLDQLDPHTATYNIVSSLRLTGPLDIPSLEQSLTAIVQRHEALRTTFGTTNGQPVQVIAPDPPSPLSIHALHHLPHPDRETEAQRLVRHEQERPFDLSQGPLFRATLIKLDDEAHILILAMHHIVSDGWSMGILYRELSALYSAFLNGRPNPLPELPVQYADFAVWQRNWLQGQVLERQLTYWQTQLDGAPPVLNLPTDHPRPPVQTFRGAVHTFTLSQSLAGALRQMSRQAGATLFMSLLAAFNVLLHLYTGQADIVVGSPIANRNRAEIEGLIGFFLNSLALRTNLAGDPRFRELLQYVRDATLAAYDNQDVPVEYLIEKLQPERDLGHAPLFQVLFVLQNMPASPLELSGLSVEKIEAAHTTAKFDLSFYAMEEDSGEITVLAEYNTDLFKAATIERMAGHYQVLLEGIVDNPAARISELPLLTGAERQQMLVEWNKSTADYPDDVCIHHLFQQQVERTPDAVAVIFEGRQLTYRDLDNRANQVAHYLQQHGVGPDSLVAICMDRSLEMIAGMLAILKAGGAYLPIDPAYPAERIAFMLADSQPALLLTQQHVIPTLPAQHPPLLALDSDRSVIAQQSAVPPASPVTADNLAYVIYTSGSTGRPKGVMIEHRALVNFAGDAQRHYRLSGTDRVLQFASISFDAAAEEIFPCLLSGAALVLRTGSMLDSMAVFLERCNAWQITLLDLPTAFWHELTAYLQRDGVTLPPSVRLVIIGGEAAQQSTLDLWQEQIGQQVHLTNTYGPTEATVVAAAYTPQPDTTIDTVSKTVPIGRPISNVRAYVLNRYLQPVPIGVPGELHLAGPGLARGYLNRPELTNEKFIPNPLSDTPGDRLYKTGDLARYLPDGNLEFLGRTDKQVKIRGFRIEPGEIEAALNRHPAVEQSLVVAHQFQPNESRLAAYIVSGQHAAPTVGHLQTFLKHHLPDYMAPSVFISLDSFPLTANGKIDYRALPGPDDSRPELDSDFVTPRSTTEKKLAALWADLLALEQVGIYDNFFELGGHSMLATKLFFDIETTFDKRLPLATLFRAPTVAQLADIIDQKTPAPNWELLAPIQPNGHRPPFFCVHGWGGGVVGYARLAELLDPDQPFYGLQARGLDGIEQPHDDIPKMAADYIKAVRTVQPNGPYYLGGYCQGGVIAFEMARQLEAQGQDVALLAIFEGYAPTNNSLWEQATSPEAMINFAGNLFYWSMDYWQLGLKGMLIRAQRKVRIFWKHTLKRSNGAGHVPLEDILDDTSHIPAHLRGLMETHSRAHRAYTPQQYHGPITLYRVKGLSLFRSFDPQLGWNSLTTGDVETKMIAGSHQNILEQPYVKTLAAQLQASLNEAQQSAHRASSTPAAILGI